MHVTPDRPTDLTWLCLPCNFHITAQLGGRRSPKTRYHQRLFCTKLLSVFSPPSPLRPVSPAYGAKKFNTPHVADDHEPGLLIFIYMYLCILEVFLGGWGAVGAIFSLLRLVV